MVDNSVGHWADTTAVQRVADLADSWVGQRVDPMAGPKADLRVVELAAEWVVLLVAQ